MTPEASAQLRRAFARRILAQAGIDDARIEQVFAQTAREKFAGPPPWFVAGFGGYAGTRDIAELYSNCLVAIDPARGINIGEPALHARCLHELALQEGETVLHVGAGVGYYTAMLAWLVGAVGRVFGYEIDSEFAARASENLRSLRNVTIEARSGISENLPQADAIYVNAGALEPYAGWRRRLRPGGRLLFPLEAPHSVGAMLLVRRADSETRWPARFIFPVSFIACVAQRDRAAERRLAERFADESWRTVRSLRFDARDATCWFAGPDWWLSAAPP
ncbi:MAG: methyltransferase [Rhodoblastus sp.]|nr:methyltransferase [Rhodoblastus sp.]MCB9997571.1 methyltransferase [Methylobacteriaceae bacterium]MCC2102215.1 methyltransferase [Hyphomicrobiales bacterium]MCO5089162.1 methyltransferase [Methylobacteriaceae bacterium]